MESIRNKFVRFNSKESFLPINIEIVDPKVKKYSKSLLFVSGFLIFTTLISLLVAYGKNSNLGIGTFTTINRVNDWQYPANFTVRYLAFIT